MTVVVAVITLFLSRDAGMAWTAIQVHTTNLLKIRLGGRWPLISNQSWMTGSPVNNKADCHWWLPKSRLLTTCWVSAKQGSCECHFLKSFDVTRLRERNLRSTDWEADALTTTPSRWCQATLNKTYNTLSVAPRIKLLSVKFLLHAGA